jgi:pyruvate dehydrogenase E2 component (dihydrolipoamide acetyltransferase)
MSEAADIVFQTLGGAGPDALLLHGFGADRLSWGANQPAWEGVARLSSLDLPGHGESGRQVGDGGVATLAARVAARLDDQAMRRVHLIGHSLGGGVALVLAETRPDLVASLALIAPAGLGQRIDPAFLAAFPDLQAPEAAEALLRRLVVRPRLIGKPLVARVLDQLRKPGAREALQKIGAALASSAPELARAAAAVAARNLPRLVVWGECDAINPASPEKLQRFGGEVVFAPGAGHLPQIENINFVNAAVADFLKRVNTPQR